ncbi:MAG: CP12 domain-containing protein [Leptolyngbyaceae bacterium]|nr:CP12 domain-containing protein [Leptolyngbyaceae bacterium]
MMKAKDIMTTGVVTVRGITTVAEAVQVMKDKGLRSLIVERRDEDDPYGIVTETDIVYKVAAYGKDPKQIRVFEIMTKPCVVVSPDLGVEYVARLFANTKIRRAPVVSGTLLGIISISDILQKSDFVEKPRRITIQDEIEVAREEARTICAQKGATSPECAVAWDIVEELQANASHQAVIAKANTKNSLQQYCEDNPEAPECRLYED